ncbi:nucleotide pyrophosphohydrolase, partial [bacterium]|nr:nucleotide pyrophosphohydrolase [bacterium]
MNTELLQKKIRSFVTERDWDQFHTPKNLVMALAGEAGELLEIFQWLSSEQSAEVMKDPKTAIRVRHELADIFVYLLRIADKLEINLEEAVLEKLQLNEQKYPVKLSKGSAVKY